VDKLLAGVETAMDLDKRYIGKAGQVVWGIVRAFLLRDDDGNPLFFITHILDITERKRAERLIADTLAFIQKMIESSPVRIITYNANGDTVWTNEATARIVGGTVEQLKALNFRQLESWKRSGLLDAARMPSASARATRGRSISC
jgi:PAS domain-containing protein